VNLPQFRVEGLAPTHKVGAFSCGDSEIDEYLHNLALVEQSQGLSRVYGLVDRDEIRGYFTLSPISIRLDEALLTTLGLAAVPYPQIGGFLLGRLGVDKSLQGQGIGKALVARASQIAARQQPIVGGVFLAVDAKTDRLVAWYEELTFKRLSPTRRRLILPLGTVPRI
jgi:GNAT superfamily N-acetyltransferase